MRRRKASADAAVSAVIGSILLVAIVVLMALAVSIAVQRFGDSSSTDKAPELAFAQDTTDRSIVVVTAEQGLRWDDLVIEGSCTPSLNGQAFPPPSGTPVEAGDVLACGPGELIRVGTDHSNGNTLLYQTEFS